MSCILIEFGMLAMELAASITYPPKSVGPKAGRYYCMLTGMLPCIILDSFFCFFNSAFMSLIFLDSGRRSAFLTISVD